MRVLDPFDASLLVALVETPPHLHQEREDLVQQLSAGAREFAEAILDEDADVSEDAKVTARSLRSWAQR
jgi:hypothetical protein